MNRSNLPSLNALRAFEAAARHLSIRAAADELCVTPGAVSQMNKALETSLSLKLFVRANRAIRLTDIGQTYLPPIRNAFRQIAEASERVMASTETNVLTLSVTPFFAKMWLVPRLGSFQVAHPDIDLQIRTSNALADFSRREVDVAIRHGLGSYPGLASDRVMAVAIVPVATPALVAKHGKPQSPADLTQWPLVHDAERKGWHAWFVAKNETEIGAPRGIAYDDSSLLVQAIIAGQGAGLLPAALVANDIAEGRLVALAEETLIDEVAYYLVYPETNKDRPKIKAFREWILDAVRSSESKDPCRASARRSKRRRDATG